MIIVRYQSPEGEPHEFSAGTRDPDWGKDAPPRWPPANLDLSPRRSGESGTSTAPTPTSRSRGTRSWSSSRAGAIRCRRSRRGSRAVAALRESGRRRRVPLPGGGFTKKDIEGPGFTAYAPLGNETVRVKLRASAATVDQVQQLVEGEARRATTAVLGELGIEERDDSFGWPVNAVAYPTGSSMAAMNLHIRDSPD